MTGELDMHPEMIRTWVRRHERENERLDGPEAVAKATEPGIRLASRYNGGPYWESDAAQGYGRGFDNNIDDARQALRD